ncbi:MAG: universal stress protein, partial [Thermoplasmata archaeon]
MFEIPRPYSLRIERIAIPMAEGRNSRRVLHIAMSISKEFNSDITAITVRDELRDIVWTDKITVITNAYKEGLSKNVKVIPKIVTGRNIRDALLRELNSHNYDLVLIASEKNSMLRHFSFGRLSEYILKNSKSPSAIVSVKYPNYPYKKIYVPLSETINTRSAVSFALHLKRNTGASLVFEDLRSFDVKSKHRFTYLFDYMNELIEAFGGDISMIRGNPERSIQDAVNRTCENDKPDAMVLGIKKNDNNKVRIN